jgi:hypothetical protein
MHDWLQSDERVDEKIPCIVKSLRAPTKPSENGSFVQHDLHSERRGQTNQVDRPCNKCDSHGRPVLAIGAGGEDG